MAQMAEMGFEKDLSDKAYARSDIKTVEALINYIDAHPNLADEPAPMNEEKPAGGQASEESPGEPISGHVNQEHVGQLVSMGHSKDCAEKALFMTQGAGVDAAQTWLEQHKGDPDFNEPLFIVRAAKPKYTPEEAKKIAKELQAKLREDRLRKDKEAEFEAEVSRLKSGKNLTQAQRDLDELQVKLEMEKLKREREETAAAKKKIMDEIEKDRRDKGLKPQSQVRKPISDLYPDIVKKMHRVYTNPEIVKVCLKTISIYLSNPI